MKYHQLKDELKQFGYEFSIQKSLLRYGMVLAGMLLLGSAFHLTGGYLVALCLWTAVWLPYFVRNSCRHHYEQQRFVDANTYMEQFLYSFQKSGKILATLEDVKKLFPTGKMSHLLEDAISHMKHTYDEEDVAEHALSMIEEKYGTAQMATMHRFALQVERNGGEYSSAILLMLDARRMWADRVCLLTKEKNRKRIQIMISIGTSLLLCYLLMGVAQSVDVDITAFPLTRVTTFAVLLIDFLIFYRTDTKLTGGYTNDSIDQKALLEDYKRVCGSQAREHMGLRTRMAKRRLERGVQEVFPHWLMEVSLLLQSENVQVALQKSYADAPVLLKPELKKMLEQLNRHPTDMEPYLSFFERLSLQEIRSSMKMLYSLSEGTGGSAGSQIMDIIRRNQILMDQAEQLKNEDVLAGMYALFLAPQITGGAKMLVDMLMIFLALLSSGLVMV